ncbi:GGDEF domain-containing protein [Selenihalanaerobacter shriftii]|uniref:Diguanylate cyclase (GGDEF) domain-containing protein n=1 Tax=Selenihalanaerobacter shriftii TaxID=142842 RepID=A0A1T4L459_9FIRM|nr:GGDEF domain-containing protein [Selenihalanaerobacter shriftii]SJZ49337.1 diguanylate cyclase (GGDEF) domain-containing protein [Selenihalanaerobacter shriftii]
MKKQNLTLNEYIPIETTYYGRKWYFIIVSLGLFLVSHDPQIYDKLFWLILFTLVIGHFISYWFMDKLKQNNDYNILWYFSFIIDLSLVGLFIAYSGGLKSRFIIAYGILMVNAGVVRPNLKEVILNGILGHISFVVTLLLYYKDWTFYITGDFWVECLLISGIFINVALATQVIQQQKCQLEEAKKDVEELASDLQKSNKELEELSYTDETTGIHNHRYFQEQLKDDIERCKRYDYPLSILMLDLDNFKVHNDTFGHPHGDQILAKIAQILKDNIRGNDVAARYGGDEFSIILIHAGEKTALKIGERVRQAVASHKFKGEEELNTTLTTSIGLAVYPQDTDSMCELVNRADQALYKAKAQGKNILKSYSQIRSTNYNGGDQDAKTG